MRIPGVPYVQGRNTYKDADGKHYGIAIHNTSNDASDTDEATNATHRTDGVSSHFYVDKDSIRQSLDTDARAGHAGSSEGNQNAIAFEFTGTNGKSRQWWLDNIDWAEVGRVIAYLIVHDPDYNGFQVRRASVAEMKANPKVKAFYSHDDMRRAWGGTTHTDPGPNFPWDKLLSSVSSALTGTTKEDDDMNAEQDARLERIEKMLSQLDGRTAQGTSYLRLSGAPEVDGATGDRNGYSLTEAHEKLDVLTARPAPGTVVIDRDDLVAAVREVLLNGVGTKD